MSEALKLEHQICFKHYVISKEIIRHYKPLLEPLGLTYTGYIAMLALWEQDGISVKRLSKRLYLDSGTLTPLLKKLEQQGLLLRQRSVKDERVVHIHLTESGKALKSEAERVPMKLIESIFPDGVDEAAAGAHVAALNQLMTLLVRDR
ncbi:MAG: MarR family transcriptional regulator [Acholeplasmatales bacterium]|nr:MAG: MarR family transcriptional regulator [Acholeplasmatales bacterium]